MANILKNKTLYQSLVLEDRIPVAKRNIIANIPDIVSIGKKTDLNKELQQVLTKLPNTNKENFSMVVGNDTNVNALLYAFTFGSDVQTQEFLENYVDKLSRKENKKNISFTKRDIALQTLQESSITDGLIKDGVITDKDLKSVFMNTNDVDNTVEKILFQEEVGEVSSNVVDLSEEFKNIKDGNITEKDIEKYINELIGKPLDTSTPPLQIQITDGNKAHVIRSNVKLNNRQKRRHQTSLNSIEKIINNATKTNEENVDLSHNTRKETLEHKANIDKYIYFKSPIIINGKNYDVELATEQVKGQDKNILDLYNVRVKTTPERVKDTLSGADNFNIQSKETEVNTINLKIGDSIKNRIKELSKAQDTNVNNNLEDTILNQNANGFFDSELKAIVLGSNFNFGTLPHEMAHFFLDKVATRHLIPMSYNQKEIGSKKTPSSNKSGGLETYSSLIHKKVMLSISFYKIISDKLLLDI